MRLSLASGLLLHGMCLLLSAEPAKELTTEERTFFEKRVRPVLANQCYQCHSAEEKIKGGLRLDTRDGLLTGGDSGPAIIPGDPDESLLIIAVRHTDEDLKMPGKKKLSPREISDLTQWVAMGAPDPRQEATVTIVSAEIDYDAGRRFWAFQPPEKPTVPAPRRADWAHDDLDRFLLAAMEDNGLEPVGDADRRTLLRRLYFDLIGLPPTPGQLEDFLKNGSPDAVQDVVDDLLGSPQFGERWGRHWLDVARYSESNGMERNFTYPHAWRYRDYVISAFNKDKPYDQFIREQLAGDLLDEESAPNTTPEERHTATGFLALGPKILNERDKQVFMMEMVDEQIDASSRAVLGLTVSCARCHDHKFDPIGMSDYYALAGIFTSTTTLYGTKGGGGNRQASALMPVGTESEELEARRKQYEKNLAASQTRLTKTTRQYQNLKKQGANNKNNARKKGRNAPARSESKLAEMREQMDRLKKEVQKLRRDAPPAPSYAMGVKESASPKDCHICLRGDPKKRGALVERGFLKVLSSDGTAKVDSAASGRRELAEWMVSRNNPLAARVMVNRIWHHLLGTGLVRTVDNFGKMGEAPSNQALLDHLAIRFMEDGWSVKRLIRSIVLSRTYQLSSNHDEGNYQIDPENRFCWQMSRRRLDAEALRDAILQASGNLELQPFEGSVVQDLGDINYGRDNSKAGPRAKAVANHRSVYLPIIRNAVPEGLRIFDFAEPSLIVGRRQITTVPTQALYLLNAPFTLEKTAIMAERVLAASAEGEKRINRLYALTLGRPASTLEQERARALLEDIRAGLSAADGQERERVAWATLAQSLIASAEFRYLD